MSAAREGPRYALVVLDAARAAWARPLPTVICALVIAAVCVVTLLTTGRTAATEAQVVNTIDSIGTRMITVTDTTGGAGIDPAAAQLLADLQGVTWAFGIGPAHEATNPSIGAVTGGTVSARALLGDFPGDLEVARGRIPVSAGEAIVGETARVNLFLSDVAGPVQVADQRLAAVGQFRSDVPLEGFENTVFYLPAEQDVPVRYLYVLAEDGVDVTDLARSVEALIPASEPAVVDVQVADSALALREVVSGTLGAASRQLMAIVLGTGLVLVAVTMIGAVGGRRRDFGRQRALGATRTHVVVSVLVHSGIAGVLGTVVGLTVGLVGAAILAGSLPSWRFSIGFGGLTVYVALLGSLPPAIAAALRDPVRILRVP